MLSDVRNRSFAVLPLIGGVLRNRRRTVRPFAFSEIVDGTGHIVVMREMEVTWASDDNAVRAGSVIDAANLRRIWTLRILTLSCS